MALEGTSIVAGREAAGVQLGSRRREVVRVLGSPTFERGGDGLVFLEYPDRHLMVALDEGSVSMVIVGPGSDLITTRGVTVGTEYVRLLELVGPLAYGEEEGLWRAEDQDGIWYELERPARPDEPRWDPPFVPQMFYVTHPDEAFVRRIYVMAPVDDDWEPWYATGGGPES